MEANRHDSSRPAHDLRHDVMRGLGAFVFWAWVLGLPATASAAGPNEGQTCQDSEGSLEYVAVSWDPPTLTCKYKHTSHTQVPLCQAGRTKVVQTGRDRCRHQDWPDNPGQPPAECLGGATVVTDYEGETDKCRKVTNRTKKYTCPPDTTGERAGRNLKCVKEWIAKTAPVCQGGQRLVVQSRTDRCDWADGRKSQAAAPSCAMPNPREGTPTGRPSYEVDPSRAADECTTPMRRYVMPNLTLGP